MGQDRGHLQDRSEAATGQALAGDPVRLWQGRVGGEAPGQGDGLASNGEGHLSGKERRGDVRATLKKRERKGESMKPTVKKSTPWSCCDHH